MCSSKIKTGAPNALSLCKQVYHGFVEWDSIDPEFDFSSEGLPN